MYSLTTETTIESRIEDLEIDCLCLLYRLGLEEPFTEPGKTVKRSINLHGSVLDIGLEEGLAYFRLTCDELKRKSYAQFAIEDGVEGAELKFLSAFSAVDGIYDSTEPQWLVVERLHVHFGCCKNEDLNALFKRIP